MKRTRSSRAARRQRLLSLLCCLGAGSLAGTGTGSAEEPEKPAEPEAPAAEAEATEPETSEGSDAEALTEWLGGNTEYTGWVDLAGGGAFVDGNQAAFRSRYGLNYDGFGGASSLHWEKFIGKNGILAIDGSAMVGNEDYNARISYTDETKGYFRAGYDHARTWYSGNGGYYPLGDLWFPVEEDDLHVDRERIWVEAGLTLPNWPVIALKYSHETREGMKDSTVWGTVQTAPGIGGLRGIAGSFRGVDEKRDIIDALVSKTFGNTDAEIGLRYEKTRLDNSLNTRSDVGGPVSAPELKMTQRENNDSDLFNVHFATDTRLNEKWMFTTAYGYTSLDSGFSGSRVYGVDYDPIYDPALARYPGYTDLTGAAQLNQHVAALNLAYRPLPTLSIIPTVRFESTGLDSDSSFLGTPTSASSLKGASSNKDFLDLSQRLEARYTGIKNWVLFTRGDWAQGNGDLQERLTTFNTGVVDLDRDTDLGELRQKYTAGANWYPLRRVNLSAQYYYKDNDYDYDHRVDSTPNDGANRYPAYLTRQNFNTHDVNFRVTLIPIGSVVSVSRYDYQTSTIDTQGEGGPTTESADIQTHIFSQSLTWNPLNRLYVNGAFSYVTDTTETPANDLTPISGLAPKAENDYWQATVGLGYILNDKTDLSAEYTYSEADNYEGLGASSLPYGAGYQEHLAVFTVARRISENLRVLARYGYFMNDDETYGGNNDYTAHMVWGSVQYRF